MSVHHASTTADATARLRRILVVDDHPLFCDALVMTLQSALPRAHLDTANRLTEALRRIAEAVPDAVMLDLNLPDVEGFDGLVRVRAAAPDARILVVSSMSENRIVASALASGADGFVAKDAARTTLIAALARVCSGHSCVPDDYVAPEANAGDAAPETAIIERLRTLTPRQTRILELVCAGKLNKQIAFDLSISETTVKAHMTAILRKLAVSSRTQAVLAAQRARFSAVLHASSDHA
ncbi:MAG: response regulator transcription factor [Pseudomonadota bacterium]